MQGWKLDETDERFHVDVELSFDDQSIGKLSKDIDSKQIQPEKKYGKFFKVLIGTIRVTDFKKWYPHTMGDQPLYSLKLTVSG